MVREQGPFHIGNPWPRIGWKLTAGVLIVSFLLGFFVVNRAPLGAGSPGVWAAICRGLGITSESSATLAPQPVLRAPTLVAWTPETLAFVAHGNADHGAFVALNCTACHGATGVSSSGLYPTLSGMEAVTIFKQLADFRSGKRSSGVMQAIAMALSRQDAADVAAYFAHRGGGLQSPRSTAFANGHGLRQRDAAERLLYIGDPARGIPPCSACHGPSNIKLGAPRLAGQHAAYIERQLGAFAQGIRQNDINEQMRTVASQLSATEIHQIASLYAEIGRTGDRESPLAKR